MEIDDLGHNISIPDSKLNKSATQLQKQNINRMQHIEPDFTSMDVGQFR